MIVHLLCMFFLVIIPCCKKEVFANFHNGSLDFGKLKIYLTCSRSCRFFWNLTYFKYKKKHN